MGKPRKIEGSGQLVDRAGLGIVVWLNAAGLAVAACVARAVPNRVAGTAPGAARAGAGSMSALLGIPVFVRLMAVVALVGGSHALHDGFEGIRWRAAGLTASRCSLLWVLSVAAEMLVFLLLGRRLLERLGPARAVTLSAVAGVVRWGTAAQMAWFPALVAVEPLHGLTFALLHLACMDVIARVVPARLAATAQAFYATIAMGATAAVVTPVSGPLYARLGGAAFWAMAAMHAAVLPLALLLRLPAPAAEAPDRLPGAGQA